MQSKFVHTADFSYLSMGTVSAQRCHLAAMCTKSTQLKTAVHIFCKKYCD